MKLADAITALPLHYPDFKWDFTNAADCVKSFSTGTNWNDQGWGSTGHSWDFNEFAACLNTPQPGTHVGPTSAGKYGAYATAAKDTAKAVWDQYRNSNAVQILAVRWCMCSLSTGCQALGTDSTADE